MSTATMATTKPNKANAYLVKEIMEASPEKLLLKVYDYAIIHCQKGDMEKTNKAISELIYSLDFNDEKGKQIAFQLLRLYQFAQDEMRKGNKEIVLNILNGLRDTWSESFNNN